jgi:hypothetical protein
MGTMFEQLINAPLVSSLLVLLFVALMYGALLALWQIRKNETAKAIVSYFTTVDSFIADAIWAVAFKDVDLSTYRLQQEELREQYPEYEFDPRLLYVAKQVELRIETVLHNAVDVDLLAIILRAERIYQQIKPELDEREDRVN